MTNPMQNLVETSTWFTSNKLDLLGKWIETAWKPQFPVSDLITLWVNDVCVNDAVLSRFESTLVLPKGYTFLGYHPTDCPVTVSIDTMSNIGDLRVRSGAFMHLFRNTKTNETLKVLVLSGFYYDDGNLITLACIPVTFMETWNAFRNECYRILHALSPRQDVMIIGGATYSFVPTVEWDDVILPDTLKNDIMDDVDSFFTKGVHIYKRLGLKPFRKLLFAGVPGTGKTMLCSAIAKWAIEREFLVIYVSSADQGGPNFNKIQQAMLAAARSEYPSIILLEEMDAYLHEVQKALVLNVLDGSESQVNDHGTMLIATTNYPEAIDERVYKRPGRLDRIYIIPEIHDLKAAEKMLRAYLGELWQGDHAEIARRLVGYPGAFVREVAIAALTLAAYEDLNELPLSLLEESYNRLVTQIDARDQLVKQNAANNGSNDS